jgi:hypothetical protein
MDQKIEMAAISAAFSGREYKSEVSRFNQFPL